MRLALASERPTVMWWGPSLTQLHNHAYGKFVRATGSPSPLEGEVGRQVESIIRGRALCGCADCVEPARVPGGEWGSVWSYAFAAMLDGEGVAGVLAECQDVTAKRAAADAAADLRLRLSEAEARASATRAAVDSRGAEMRRLKEMFAQAPGFMCILDGPDHVFEFGNGAFTRLIGGRDLRWKAAREALADLDGQGFFEKLDEAYRSGLPFEAREVALSIQRREGAPPEPRFVDFVCQPLLGDDGRATGIFVEGFDVTERRAAVAAREASEARLKEGMLAARMVVWDWDLATDAMVFSDNAPALLGGNWTDVGAARLSVHPEDLESLVAKREAAIVALGSYEDVVRIHRPDNGNLLWLQVRASVVAGLDGRAARVRGVSVDVTERKRAEEALRLADRRKDQFLAMLAHELRNPLAPIVSAAQVLKARNAGDSGAGKAAEIVARQAAHMSSLIDDVLDVSRFNTGLIELDARPVNLRAVLSDAAEQARPAMEARRHRFAAPGEGEPIMVNGDAKRLLQAVANLLQNAAKFTPPGGNIELSVSTDPRFATVRVRDDGIGIDAEMLPHIFEIFRQAERASESGGAGLGLGLSLVKSLAMLHGGTVSAASAGAGAGSVFAIELPLGAGGATVSGAPAASSRTALRPLEILVVDDHLDAARMLRMVLEEAGHRVQVETDPLLVLSRAGSACVDVFLLDIGMPGMDGNELARAIRELPGCAAATLVAVTGHGDRYGQRAARAAGFDHYFVKPADPSQLLALLAEIAPRKL